LLRISLGASKKSAGFGSCLFAMFLLIPFPSLVSLFGSGTFVGFGGKKKKVELPSLCFIFVCLLYTLSPTLIGVVSKSTCKRLKSVPRFILQRIGLAIPTTSDSETLARIVAVIVPQSIVHNSC
jgi:hypothetical protein